MGSDLNIDIQVDCPYWGEGSGLSNQESFFKSCDQSLLLDPKTFR